MTMALHSTIRWSGMPLQILPANPRARLSALGDESPPRTSQGFLLLRLAPRKASSSAGSAAARPRQDDAMCLGPSCLREKDQDLSPRPTRKTIPKLTD